MDRLRESFLQEVKKGLFFYDDSLNLDMPICRYMDFDKFLNILNGEFYVPQKVLFEDISDQGIISFRKKIVVGRISTPDDTPEMVEKNKEIKEQQRKKIQKKAEDIDRSKHFLTSCWQQGSEEDYLMWKSYTSRVGVRIETSIMDFLSSIDFVSEGVIPIVASIRYNGLQMQESIENNVFSKENAFRSEREIRFYFLPFDPESFKDIPSDVNSIAHLIIEKSVNGETPEKKSQYFKLDNLDFIHNITLSPFINTKAQKQLKTLLEQYPWEQKRVFTRKVQLSKINNQWG